MSSPKVWLVTGSSSGLGFAVVNYALSKGDIVVATLRKPEALSKLSAKYDDSKLLVVKLDVTNPDEISSAFSIAHKTYGRIDIVYNNAGYAIIGEVEITPDKMARDLFEVNFWGAANVTREAVRFFRDVNTPSGGRLVQASSGAGMDGNAVGGYYSASKFALEGLTEALQKALDPSWNITISLLELGAYKTQAIDNAVIIPANPRFINTTSAIRAYFDNYQELVGLGDCDKAAREIYKIANDEGAPLHIPFGLDSIALVKKKIGQLDEEVEKAAVWSSDLV
ncbi:hypothetical protein BDQ17DRAFT_1544556 [Cyathus striatus]|nr:hypothetical protein BDQ17DRAFT_1544556 [Cyathus striatus]